MSLTHKWLSQQVQPYPNASRVFADIDATLSRLSSLRPKSDVFTFDDGRSQLLLCVHGLMPINYRGASYNIPVAFWITKEYPRQPPISYVVPTNDMVIKAGTHLDVSGKCNTEYIQNWERKDEGCSLSALIESLQDHFSREPPVYSKPKNPLPPGSAPARPALPDKPSSSTNDHAPSSSALAQLALPPPRPPPPPRLEQAWPSPNFSSISPVRGSPLHSGPHIYHLDHPTGQPLSPPPPPTLPAVSPPPSVSLHSQSHGPLRPKPLPIPVPDLLDQEENTVANQTFVAPPHPPNPELLRLHAQVHDKLTTELSSLTKALALDAARLRAHQADLLAGEPAIKDEMARLEAVRDVCHNVADRSGQAIRKAEANIAELRRKGDPEVDELVCATTIVHNQLINLIADDNAIEDTIYHLHRALNVGRIDLERFLRSTRILAEEQFMKRALIEKIQTSMSSVPSSSIAPDWV